MKALIATLAFGLLAFGAWSVVESQDYVVGGWGGGYHASTAGEGYARGMADVIRSQGAYNLATSAAVINLEEAKRQEIDNRLQWTENYFEMRRINKAYHDSLKKPRDPEAALRYAEAQRPKRLTPKELDAVSGQIHWPDTLKADKFAQQRQELDKLFAERAYTGVASGQQQNRVEALTKAMMESLKGDIGAMAPADYTASKQFLVSLGYEARLPGS